MKTAQKPYRLTVTLSSEIGEEIRKMRHGKRTQYISKLIEDDLKAAKRKKAFEDFKNMPPLKMKGDPTVLLRKMRQERTQKLLREYGK